MTSGALVLAAIAGAVVVILGARLRGWATAPRRPAVGRGARLGRFHLRARRPAATDVEVAAWCERVASGVRAGSSLTRAVIDADAATVPGCRPFPDAGHAVGRGRALADALDANPNDPTGAVALLTPVMVAAAELGGPSAGALDRVADTLLARAAERAERRTNSAQARLSARVMTMLPFGVLAVLMLSEPAIRQVLTTPAGLSCVVVGSALNSLGWLWMRHLIGGAS